MDRLEEIKASVKVMEYDIQNVVDAVLPAHAVDWRRRIANILRLLDEETAEVERLTGERDAAAMMYRAAKELLHGSYSRMELAIEAMEAIYSAGVPMDYADYSRLHDLISAIVPEGGPADEA